jgi:hypothetical protein
VPVVVHFDIKINLSRLLVLSLSIYIKIYYIILGLFHSLYFLGFSL